MHVKVPVKLSVTPLHNIAPQAMNFGCPEVDDVKGNVHLGGGNNVILTRKHVKRLRHVVARKEKLRRLLSSSDGKEIPRKLVKMISPGVNRIVVPTPRPEDKSKHCRSVKIQSHGLITDKSKHLKHCFPTK